MNITAATEYQQSTISQKLMKFYFLLLISLILATLVETHIGEELTECLALILSYTVMSLPLRI